MDSCRDSTVGLTNYANYSRYQVVKNGLDGVFGDSQIAPHDEEGIKNA